MEETEVSDDLSDWEQIQSPFPQTRPSLQQSTSQRQIVPVVDKGDDRHSHGDPEGLSADPVLRSPPPPPPQEPNSPSPSSSSSSPTPPPATPPSPRAPPSSSSSTNSKREEETPPRRQSDSRLVAAREVGKRLKLRLGILSAEILRAASKVCNYRIIAGRFWSAVSLAGVVTAVLLALLYVKLKPRWRTRRVLRDDKERLVLLLKQKDEKISQLMVQIAEMNEALSARRRVPVLRVG